MDRNSALTIEALRFSLHSVVLLFDRLTAAGLEIERDGGKPDFTRVFLLLSDCWSIIDSADRARELVGHVKGLKKKSPEVQLFLRSTKSVEKFRNVIQHIATEIPKLPENSRPVLGAYSWIREDNELQSVTIWLTGSGQRSSSVGLVVDTWERRFANNNVFSMRDNEIRLDTIAGSCSSFSEFFNTWLISNQYLSEIEIVPSRAEIGVSF